MGQSGAVPDASFLSSSFSSSPQVPGGFQLNYDRETPLRAIDLGGDDQQEKFVHLRVNRNKTETLFFVGWPSL
jgi:hypothetical protein